MLEFLLLLLDYGAYNYKEAYISTNTFGKPSKATERGLYYDVETEHLILLEFLSFIVRLWSARN